MSDQTALTRPANRGVVPATPSIPPAFVTTTFTLDGYRVVRNIGVVRGIVVRSRSVIGNLGAAFQMIFGGHISVFTTLCEQARREAYEIMIDHAAVNGANAIVGMAYDATEIASGVTEVLCYGTAVVVEPVQRG